MRQFFVQLRIQTPPPPTRPPLHQGSDNQQFVGQLVSLILYEQARYKDFLFVLSNHNSVFNSLHEKYNGNDFGQCVLLQSQSQRETHPT